MTLGQGCGIPDYISGPQITELQIEFKYQHSYIVGSGPGVIEVVNAVDTSNDPWGGEKFSTPGTASRLAE